MLLAAKSWGIEPNRRKRPTREPHRALQPLAFAPIYMTSVRARHALAGSLRTRQVQEDPVNIKRNGSRPSGTGRVFDRRGPCRSAFEAPEPARVRGA